MTTHLKNLSTRAQLYGPATADRLLLLVTVGGIGWGLHHASMVGWLLDVATLCVASAYVGTRFRGKIR